VTAVADMAHPTLSLHQPYASLCLPLGDEEEPVKEWETRGWSTKYRGRLLIHAAKTEAAMLDLCRASRRYDKAAIAIENILDRKLGWNGWTYLETWGTLPLGSIIGSVELLDVVPIVDEGNCSKVPGRGPIIAVSRGGQYLTGLTWANTVSPGRYIDERLTERVSDQLPYGDYSAGRFACLFGDAKRTDQRCPACWGSGSYPPVTRQLCRTCHGRGACPPIPARGRQGIFDWSPA